MSSQKRYSDEFKRDAVALVVERGYPVSKAAKRLGVRQQNLNQVGA